MLYIKLNKQPETVKELLKAFFSDKHTSVDYYRCVETYYDKECLNEHCPKNKTRSWDDTYELVNTYFPDTTSEVLIKEILTLNVVAPNGTKLYPHLSFCNEIRRLTIYYFATTSSYDEFHEFNTDEDGWELETDYTWEELLSKIGIYSREELIEYVDNHRN